jgi:hypothetical protein
MTDSTTIVPDMEQPEARTGRKRGMLRDGLFVTDEELIKKLGVPEKIARQALQALDAQRTGFPQKQKLWGDRRYWPAVRAYLDTTFGLRIPTYPQRSERHAR